jgi:hypothetical protein
MTASPERESKVFELRSEKPRTGSRNGEVQCLCGMESVFSQELVLADHSQMTSCAAQVRCRQTMKLPKRRNVKRLRPDQSSSHLRTVNPWLIGRNGESLPPDCQMKAYALVPALEGRVARMAKLADPPDLGFRNRRFHNVPLRFHRSPIYGRKTRFFNYQSRVDDRFHRAVWNRCVSCNCICD